MNETPNNGAFMAAAYIANAVILLGYAFSLWRRARASVSRPDGTPAPR